jgi:hypothetical protein
VVIVVAGNKAVRSDCRRVETTSRGVARAMHASTFMLPTLFIPLAVIIVMSMIMCVALLDRAMRASLADGIGSFSHRFSDREARRSVAHERALATYIAVEVGADPPRQAEDPDEVLQAAARGESGTSDESSDETDEIDAIGQAAGLLVADGKPLRGRDEADRRDNHRWELDPESAKDERPETD